jgi:hypothetical protein
MRRWAFIVVGLALVARLPVILAILAEPGRAVISSDCQQYLGLAERLLAHGVFSLNTAPPFNPEIIRTPGYPVFLTGILFWCGGSACLAPIVIVQAVLGALIAPGVLMLGTRVVDERTGRLAAVLYAVAPVPAIMNGFVQSETLFSALLVGGLLVLVARREVWAAAVTGVIMGAAALVRPIGLWVVPLVAVAPLLDGRLQGNWRRSLALVVGAALITLPWMARNANLYGRFKLSTIDDINLYYYNVAGTEARRLGIPVDEARDRMAAQLTEWPQEGFEEPNERAGAFARHLIWEHPLWFAWGNALDALNGFRPGFSFMFFLFGDGDTTGSFSEAMMQNDLAILLTQQPLIVAVALYMTAFLALLIVFGALGIVGLLWERSWRALLLLAAVPAWLLYMPGLASNARFRAPVAPLLVILAAWGIVGMALPHFQNLVAALEAKRRGQPSSS